MARTGTTLTAPAGLTESQRARRDRIIDAALALSRGRSVDNIQVKDVAEEAGVALGTVYHYFSSKDHLFAEALLRWAGDLRNNVRRHPLAGPTPAERLRDVLHRSIRAFQQQPYLGKLVSTLTLSSDPFAIEIITRLDQATSTVYAEALAGVDETTIAAIVRAVELVLDGLIRLWSAGRLSIVDVYDRIDEAVDLLLRTPP